MSGRLPVACGQVPSRATQPSGVCTEGPCVPRSWGLALALPLPTPAVRGNEARPSFSPTQLGKGPGPLTHVPLQMTGFSFRQTQASPDAGQTAVHGAFAHRHVPALITAGPGPSSPRHGGTRGFSARDTVPAADEDDERPPTPPFTSGVGRRATQQHHPLALAGRHRASRPGFEVFEICREK